MVKIILFSVERSKRTGQFASLLEVKFTIAYDVFIKQLPKGIQAKETEEIWENAQNKWDVIWAKWDMYKVSFVTSFMKYIYKWIQRSMNV